MYLFLIGLGLLLLTLFGAPLFTIISAIALLAFHAAEIDASAVIIELNRMAAQPVLLAIPLFTFAGYLMAESNAPLRLVRLSRIFFRKLPGGLGLVSLASCAVFTAFTGASGVTIIALGGLLYPILQKEHYPQNFSLGLLTASGNLGLLFPPSLPIILYGLVAQASIDRLFLAGILPGILMVALLMLYNLFFMRRQPVQKFETYPARKALKEAAWEIPLPFIILGGIYSGLFTATEAAAVTAFYVFVVEVFIYRDISLTGDLPRIIRESMILVGGILVILSSALGLANYLIDAEIPMRLMTFLEGYLTSKYSFLLVLNLFLLVVGAMMDIFSAILVIVPIMIPIATHFGVDPIHLGIIFLANLGIGYSTPPVGMNLFIASFRFEQPVLKLYKAALPFLAILLVALAIITYVPWLSTALLAWIP